MNDTEMSVTDWRTPWNKDKLIGQQPSRRELGALHTRLEMAEREGPGTKLLTCLLTSNFPEIKT